VQKGCLAEHEREPLNKGVERFVSRLLAPAPALDPLYFDGDICPSFPLEKYVIFFYNLYNKRLLLASGECWLHFYTRSQTTFTHDVTVKVVPFVLKLFPRCPTKNLFHWLFLRREDQSAEYTIRNNYVSTGTKRICYALCTTNRKECSLSGRADMML
jgi:hypothetical protein